MLLITNEYFPLNIRRAPPNSISNTIIRNNLLVTNVENRCSTFERKNFIIISMDKLSVSSNLIGKIYQYMGDPQHESF